MNHFKLENAQFLGLCGRGIITKKFKITVFYVMTNAITISLLSGKNKGDESNR